ncbi:MAG: ABC transporter ATP-binding protein [bacterium]
MRDFWRAIKFAAVNKKLTFYSLATALIGVAFGISLPLVFKALLDLVEVTIKTGVASSVPDIFWVYIILYAALTLGESMLGQINFYVITLWENKTREELSKKVFAHLESLSLNYFESNSTGKIKERIDKGIWDLIEIMEGVFIEIIPQFIYIMIAAAILFSVNIVFGTILLASVPIFIFISIRFSPAIIKIQDGVRDSNERLSGLMTESIINIKTIKSYATEDRHFKNFLKLLLDSILREVRYVVLRIKMNILRVIVSDFAKIFIIGLGIYWILTGKITLGAFTLAWQYTNRSLQPLWYITRVIDRIQKNMRSVRRVFELIDTEPEVKDKTNAKKLRVTNGEISFKNITFGYKDRKIIKDLSLDVPSGKVLAIVGKSGSGKTTLVKLLSRFYDIKNGNINIDNVNIDDVTQRSLRENIGVVLQDSILFNDTAANNIAYGKPRATRKEIIQAAKSANAHEFILKLPDRYETVVGERGVKLSGGEQQRINIARAILKNPPILVLDEATSSLDSESEQLIQEALWRLIEGKTTIIIAHRLSTVMKADIIVVMDNGKISEKGTHNDLVKEKGIYAKLFEIQSGGYLK